MKKYTSLQFYLDSLAVQNLFGDDQLYKEAQSGEISSLTNAIKEGIVGQFDNDDKIGTALRILAPGAVLQIFRSLKMPWVGLFLSLAMNIFNVDVAGIFRSIYDKISNLLKSQGHVSPEQVDEAVDGAQITIASIDSLTLIKKSNLYRLSYQNNIFKTAGPARETTKVLTTNFLKVLFKWTIKTVLMAGGLLLAGGAIKGILGMPPAPGKPALPGLINSSNQPSQDVFKATTNSDKILNGSGATWMESSPPTYQNISDMMLDWMSEVYPEAQKYEQIASQTIAFKTIVDDILKYNSNSKNNYTLIPRKYESKKQVVDMFINKVVDQIKK